MVKNTKSKSPDGKVRKLTVSNFQCWEHLEIELDPFCTTLTGRNDLGKTAVLRALRWLAMNKPDGDTFIRWSHLHPSGNKTAEVRCELDDHSVIRRKGKGVNEYVLDGKSLVAFGRGEVPSPVTSLLNLDAINFQRQFDAMYWLSESAGQVSRELNSIINLGVIDSTLSYAASELRKAKAEVQVSEQRLEEAKRQKQELSWVPEMAGEWGKLQEAEQERDGQEEVVNRLERMVGSLEEAERAASVEIPDLSELDGLVEKLEGQEESVDRLALLVGHFEEAVRQAAKSEMEAVMAEEKLHKRMKGSCPICGREIK